MIGSLIRLLRILSGTLLVEIQIASHYLRFFLANYVRRGIWVTASCLLCAVLTVIVHTSYTGEAPILWTRGIIALLGVVLGIWWGLLYLLTRALTQGAASIINILADGKEEKIVTGSPLYQEIAKGLKLVRRLIGYTVLLFFSLAIFPSPTILALVPLLWITLLVSFLLQKSWLRHIAVVLFVGLIVIVSSYKALHDPPWFLETGSKYARSKLKSSESNLNRMAEENQAKTQLDMYHFQVVTDSMLLDKNAKPTGYQVKGGEFVLATGEKTDPGEGLAMLEVRVPDEFGLFNNSSQKGWLLRSDVTAETTDAYQKYRKKKSSQKAKAQAVKTQATQTSPYQPTRRTSVSYVLQSNPLLEQAASRHDVPMRLMQAVWMQESSGQTTAPTSSAGAVCPMQIIPDTARMFGTDPNKLSDPAVCFDTGARILKKGLDEYGSYELTLLYYFTGAKYPEEFKGLLWEQIPKDRLASIRDTNGVSAYEYVTQVMSRVVSEGSYRLASKTPHPVTDVQAAIRAGKKRFEVTVDNIPWVRIKPAGNHREPFNSVRVKNGQTVGIYSFHETTWKAEGPDGRVIEKFQPQNGEVKHYF